MTIEQAMDVPPHIAQLAIDVERARLAPLHPDDARLDGMALRLVGSGVQGARQVLLELHAEFRADLARVYPNAPFSARLAHATRQLSRVFDRASSWERPGCA